MSTRQSRRERADWEAIAAREIARFEDGERRLPDDPDPRQRQLVRMAMAAGGAALALLMQGREDDARRWLGRSAERYRESLAGAPPESWGRLVGAVKARLLARDWAGAEADARWALDQGPAEAASPIGRYAAVLANLALGENEQAARLAASLASSPAETFPRPVADALAALAAGDAGAYGDAVAAVLRSFETRKEYLEDVPVADTVLALQALAERRGLAVALESPLLPR